VRPTWASASTAAVAQSCSARCPASSGNGCAPAQTLATPAKPPACVGDCAADCLGFVTEFCCCLQPSASHAFALPTQGVAGSHEAQPSCQSHEGGGGAAEHYSMAQQRVDWEHGRYKTKDAFPRLPAADMRLGICPCPRALRLLLSSPPGPTGAAPLTAPLAALAS